MDITKYLSNIDLPAADEIQAKAFLASKENTLHENILKLWNEFILTENKNAIADMETHGNASPHNAAPDIIVPLPEFQADSSDIVLNTATTTTKAQLLTDEDKAATKEIKPSDTNNMTIDANLNPDNSPKEDFIE